MAELWASTKTTMVRKEGSIYLTFEFENFSQLVPFARDGKLTSAKLPAHGVLWWVTIPSQLDHKTAVSLIMIFGASSSIFIFRPLFP